MFNFTVPIWLMIGNVIVSIILGILLINRVYDKGCLLTNNLSAFVYSYLSIGCIVGYVFSAAVCYIYVNKTPLTDFWVFYVIWVVLLLMGLFVLITGSKKKWRKRRSTTGLRSDSIDVKWD